jgi:hypothetical protein
MKSGWMIAERWQGVIIFHPTTGRCRDTFWRFSGGRHRAIVSARRETMKLYGTRDIDNRDSEQVYYYMEARIEALKQRIKELETEKETLRARHSRTQVA